jgi:hypothetical protein
MTKTDKAKIAMPSAEMLDAIKFVFSQFCYTGQLDTALQGHGLFSTCWFGDKSNDDVHVTVLITPMETDNADE